MSRPLPTTVSIGTTAATAMVGPVTGNTGKNEGAGESGATTRLRVSSPVNSLWHLIDDNLIVVNNIPY